MSFYENTLITKQDLPKTELDKIKNKYSELINSSSGKVIKIEEWGLLNLARKIKTNLTWIKFILILIIIEIIAGASMYYFAFPILSQPIHLLIAIIIFGLQFYWYLILDD